MFYKKRIEQLEIKLERLTRELERNEAIGSYGPYVFGYAHDSNKNISRRVKGNNRTIRDVLEYLDVEYVFEKERLVKREQVTQHETEDR